MDEARKLGRRKAKKTGARPAFFADYRTVCYVVERGLTAIAVAGTMAVPGFDPE
jgi:hypothetical protein